MNNDKIKKAAEEIRSIAKGDKEKQLMENHDKAIEVVQGFIRCDEASKQLEEALQHLINVGKRAGDEVKIHNCICGDVEYSVDDCKFACGIQKQISKYLTGTGEDHERCD